MKTTRRTTKKKPTVKRVAKRPVKSRQSGHPTTGIRVRLVEDSASCCSACGERPPGRLLAFDFGWSGHTLKLCELHVGQMLTMLDTFGLGKPL